ncbi:MAG: general secretion pathway protein GspE [Planctomycetaceae bacterium]|jgi:hypothetical protein|nr:general secretion pathway protein GspE [Planctomycetaceae bacterium]
MAKAQIDVYRDWLGIQEPNRPLNYYQLLRLKAFEDDASKIRDNYRKMNAHVRKYASGDYASETQVLLNELAKAMLCLTDTARKLEYDISLGRKIETAKARRSLEQILIANNIVPSDRMKQVKSYADTVGIDLQEAVLQQKIAAAEVVMLAYAESIGLPFVSVEDIGVDETIAPQINPNTARQHSFVPLMVDRGQLLLASPKPVNPDVEEELRMIFDMPVRSTICVPAEINTAIAKYYPRDAVQLIRKTDGSTAAAKGTPAPSSKSSAAKSESVEPMSDEEKKNRLMNSIVVFNFSVMIVCVGLYFLNFPRALQNHWLQFPVLALLGVIVGGIAALFTWKKFTR